MRVSRSVSIRQRMILGYSVIAIAVSISVIVSFFIFKKTKDLDEHITNVQIPALGNLKRIEQCIIDSRRLSNNWIYQANEKEKGEFTDLVFHKIPLLSDSLNAQLSGWASSEDQTSFQSFRLKLDSIIYKEAAIIKLLPDAFDRSNDMNNEAASQYLVRLEKEVEIVLGDLKPLIEHSEEQFSILQVQKKGLYNTINYMLLCLLILTVAISVVSVNNTIKGVIKPLSELKKVMLGLSKGEILPIKSLNRIDEIGEMNEAMVEMLQGIKEKTDFAVHIGNGKYDMAFKPSSEKDTLGLALIEMRTKLKENAEEEGKRVWATSGQAQFGDVLRAEYASDSAFYAAALMFIVKYMKVNQGGLFLVEEQEGERSLNLVACYAYEKNKHIKKRVEIGEGLLGQCYLEKESIYLTEVPQNYLTITSGLGDASPRAVLLVPLILNEEVFGVLEVASFSQILNEEVLFMERIAMLMTSAIAAVKTNGKTRALLDKSQLLAEQMKAQEEEMRQNMEELIATQEDWKRKEKKYSEILKEHGISIIT